MKLCKHCKIELKESDKGSFCSEWCKEMKLIENRSKSKLQIKEKRELLKYKNYKVRKCGCGNDLKKGQSRCLDCQSEHKFKYVVCEQKCLFCGGEIIARNHIRKKKIFCQAQCSKSYKYLLHKK